MTALVILQGVVIVLLVVLVAGLLKSHAEILRRLHALDGGETSSSRAEGLQISPLRRAAIPDSVAGVDPSGASVSVSVRSSRGLVLLAFLSTGCSTCRPFWSALAGEIEMMGRNVRPVAVTKGTHEESPTGVSSLAPPGLTTIMSSEAWDAFGVPVSPYFVLVEASSGAVLGEGAAASWDHVRNLMEQAMADAGVSGSSTRSRSERTGEQLAAAGLEPGDPSLYRNPHDPDEP
ncbi:hypothetical protein BH23ACT5_BH23ACT5_01640 [soil metagenome]